MECSKFEPWSRSWHCVLGQNTLLSQCLFSPRGMMNLMLGVTLRWTRIPSRGEKKYSWSLNATETRISSVCMGQLS